MDHSRKLAKQIAAHRKRESACFICGKHFKSRSRFDAICNLCWADNEMRPYLAPGKSRKAFVH
jgi:hypothetical protein